MLKFLNLIVKSYWWYDRESVGKKDCEKIILVVFKIQVYRWLYELENINVYIKLFICLYWKLKLIKCKLNIYFFEI